METSLATVGRYSYGDVRIHSWGEGAKLRIGSYCSIAGGVQVFLGGEHRTDWITTFPFTVFWEEARAIQGHVRSKGDVVIGNDVWVGAEVVILSGVHVGDGAVIGARAVVGADVSPYSVVVGNPARELRLRFDTAVIERLLRIRWWDRSDREIARLLPLLQSDKIEEFLAAVESRDGA